MSDWQLHNSDGRLVVERLTLAGKFEGFASVSLPAFGMNQTPGARPLALS